MEHGENRFLPSVLTYFLILILNYMKIQIVKAELLEAIKTVIKIVPSKAIIPVIENICLQGKNGIVTISGTDLTTYVKYTLNQKSYFEGNFEFLIDAAKFDKIASLCDNYVEMEVMGDKCKITTLQGNTTLPIYEASCFPDKKEIGDKIADFSEKQNVFFHIKKAIGYVSTDELRASMCGVHLDVVDNTLSVQATNANILYLHDTECASKINTNVVVPTKTCKILTSLENDDFSLYQISGTEYRFQYQTIDIYFTAMDGRYPQVRSIVPKVSDHINIFSFKKSDIIKTISAVMITANIQTNGIQFYVGDETAKIKSVDLDNNMESEMELKVSIDKKVDDVFKFAVNGKFITDVINSVNLPNSEQITFYMRELNKALLFYTDDFKTLHIVMPIVFND